MKNRKTHHSLRSLLSKNCRGSHVDVIISFVIFIGFIVFAYILLQPTVVTKQNKETIANSLEASLVKNLSNGTNGLIIISVAARQNSLKNCINLKSFLSNANINNTLAVKDSAINYPAYNSSSDLFIDLSSNIQFSYLFNIYYSPFFNPIPQNILNGCNTLQQGSSQNNYTIGQTEVVTFASQNIFDFNVISLINIYNQNYNSVKNWFNLSAGNNFGFNFTYQNQTTIGTRDKIPQFAEVYSQSFPVLYIVNNSSLQSGLLTIRIW